MYLHVGHAKTGSSFIQSVFARNIDALAAAGIHYPPLGDPEEIAQGRISSGNGKLLLDDIAALAPMPAGCRGVLFSREQFFHELTEAPLRHNVAAAARFYGCDRVEILLFIRDPIGSMISTYQQGVKRGGMTASLSEFAAGFNTPMAVFERLKSLLAEPAYTVTVRNYSRCKDRLADVAMAWLGLPDLPFVLPDNTQVNRSLTAGELAFQRALNRVLGTSGGLVADPLCEELPQIPTPPLALTEAEQSAVLDRLAPSLAAANALIAPEHHYRADPVPPQDDTDDLTLSRAQIDIIARSMGEEIQRLRQSNDGLRSVVSLLHARRHIASEDLDEAEAHLRRSVGFNGRNMDAVLTLADVLMQKGGDRDEIDALLKTGRGIDSGNRRLERLTRRFAKTG
ncbi:hypothetical protein [Acuticoccus kandeliae]|uniref:hypothetical protein n=1 Tax=Acuticoccus kandeliae TaxID=2073160 RepID=UPI000D3E4ACD|nr:hypothetical protein [Acuticoccus kandeliae]